MQRIAVCRLVPLWFALDTETPAWSSYMLTKAIKCLSQINGITLSEIGVAFLEVLCQFSTNLNRYVYHFCIDISREFTIQHRRRRNEFESLVSWNNSQCNHLPSVAFLKYVLVPIGCHTPAFLVQTITSLIQNEYLGEFIIGIQYHFEDPDYKQDFLNHLQKSELSVHDQNRIAHAIIG